jgi:hypothetical protein
VTVAGKQQNQWLVAIPTGTCRIVSMMKTNERYTVQKAYASTLDGRQYAIWNVIETIKGVVHVIDTFSLRRDAKLYAELCNSESARNGFTS